MALENYGRIMQGAADFAMQPYNALQEARNQKNVLQQRDRALAQDEAQNAFVRQRYAEQQGQQQQTQQSIFDILEEADTAFEQGGFDAVRPHIAKLAAYDPQVAQAVAKSYEDDAKQAGGGIGNYNPGDYTPETWARFAAGGFKDPSGLQRYVTPAQDKVVMIGGVPTMVDPRTHQVAPLSDLPTEIAGKAATAEATAAAKSTGTSRAEAAAALPKAEGAAEMVLGTIKSLRENEGTRFLYGGYALAPIVPNTPQADAASYLDQLGGQAFLQAFESLKGGGQITEVEGKKATDALMRLNNRRMSYGAALKAMKEFEYNVNLGLQKARQRAGQQNNNDPLGIRR